MAMESMPVGSNGVAVRRSESPRETRLFTIDPEHRFQLSKSWLAQYAGTQPAWGYGTLSYLTYKRTYARPVGDSGRTEEFWETARRVVEGAFSLLRQQIRRSGQRWDEDEGQRKAQEMYRRIWAFKFLPPGRGLWFMGTPALEIKGGAALNSCGFVSTADIDQDFSAPFRALMDYSMLGVGMGFDVNGAGRVRLSAPLRSDVPRLVADTREGWIDAAGTVLDAYAGTCVLPRFDYSAVRPEGTPLKTFGGTASGPGPLMQLVDTLDQLCARYVGQEIDSAFIVDAMNVIGRCVVAGSVRRSSEIALGRPDDATFMELKDPRALRAWTDAQGAIEHAEPRVVELDAQVTTLRAEQQAAGAMSEQAATLQDRLDTLAAERRALLAADDAWTELEARINAHPMRTHRWASNNTVLLPRGARLGEIAAQIARNGEPGVGWLDVARAYGRLVDAPNHKDDKAVGWNPCVEQTLWNNELCCLVESFPTHHDSLEDWLTTLKYAYLYAKIVTLVPTHNPATNAVMSRNRRIGTSMAGIFELYERLGAQECIRWWDTGYKHLRELDADYSGWMGVPESIKVSSAKPGGSVPLLAGCEGGMKAPTAAYYFRAIRLDHTSPMVDSLRAAGYRVETDRYAPRTVVAYFPCKAAEGVRTGRDVSMWEQAEIAALLQRYWADNQVSATITFRPDEARDIGRLLETFEGRLKAVSFLPLDDHAYVQAPYTPCTRAEYEAAIAQLKPLDLSTSQHESDERFCSGDVCERPSFVP